MAQLQENEQPEAESRADTKQVNIRLSRRLVADVELIGRLLHTSPSDWIKQQLAERVYETKIGLLERIGTLHKAGIINDDDHKELIEHFRSIASTKEPSAIQGRKNASKAKDTRAAGDA